MKALTAPVLGVGAIVRRDNRVLLVRRAREPALGEWAVPGGRVQLGETLQAAAERETFEETGIRIEAGEAVHSFELIDRNHGEVRYHFVVIDLVARYVDGEPRAGDDASDARWVGFGELSRLPLNAETRRVLAKLFPNDVQE